jgi:hypothetical protein
MLPPASYKIEVVRAVFEDHGIHVLEEFPDGQTRWGNEPLTTPYRGLSHMADESYKRGRYDIFTIRAIANKLDKAGDLPKMEDMLNRALGDEEYEVGESPKD